MNSPRLLVDEYGPFSSKLPMVIITGVNVAKALVKFNFGFGKISKYRKIFHGGLLLLVSMIEAIIPAGFDRYGHIQPLFYYLA